jgi:small-conductance mechanosensitive channel
MFEIGNHPLLEFFLVMTGGLVLGVLLNKVFIPFVLRMTRKTKWSGDEMIISAVAPWMILWSLLAALLYGLSILSKFVPLVARHESLVLLLINTAFIFSITLVIAGTATRLLNSLSTGQEREYASTSILGNTIRAVIYSIGLMLVLRLFGVAITPLLAALGVGGLAVALALQPTLSNLFAGLQLIASKKINIGDFVQLEGGQKGFIKDITWRNTDIETAQNNLIIVPNSKMTNSIIENYFINSPEVLFNVSVGVSYDSDLEKVERVCLETGRTILQESAGGVRDFEPFVRFYQFGESSIDLKIFLRSKTFGDQFLMTSEFIKMLHCRFNEEGIVIPFPVRTVLIRSQTQENMVSGYTE